jgi:hypothetical protein
VQKRKSKHEQEDRDKTLEPNDISATHQRTLHPLAKSATSAIFKTDRDLGYSSSHKERTPYRLSGRHKNKYLESAMDINNNANAALDSPYDTSPSANPSTVSKYQKQYAPTAASDYVGSRLGKENTYKSKYDPDSIYSELSGSTVNGSSGRRRQYRRNDSDKQPKTAINLYEVGAEKGGNPPRRDYTQRKSATSNNLYQRSRAQQYQDLESSTADSDERDKERENKRKEIQSLIQKYAQMDDFYGKALEDNNNGMGSKQSLARMDRYEDNNDSAYHSPVHDRHDRHLQKSQTMHNLGPYNSRNTNISSNHVPNLISYDNAVWVPPIGVPNVRSRIPKALSTFVRIKSKLFFLYCNLLRVVFFSY